MEETKLGEEGPDGSTLMRIAAGDPAAEAELYRKHLGLVLAVGQRTGLSLHDAEEVAQDVLLETIEHARSSRLKDTVPAWLVTVTRRRAIDWQRRAGVQRRQDGIVLEELTLVAGDPQKAAGRILSHGEFAVRRALRELEESDREILSWVAHRASNADLAVFLRVTENTARQRRMRALRRFKEQLVRFYGERATPSPLEHY